RRVGFHSAFRVLISQPKVSSKKDRRMARIASAAFGWLRWVGLGIDGSQDTMLGMSFSEPKPRHTRTTRRQADAHRAGDRLVRVTGSHSNHPDNRGKVCGIHTTTAIAYHHHSM